MSDKPSRFEPITLIWDDQKYQVDPDRVWGLIKVIEDHISFVRLAQRMAVDDIPELTIAEAYRDALRYAGCRQVRAEDIQLDTTGAQRMGHAYALLQILSMAQPDFKKKLKQDKDKAPPRKRKARAKKPSR